MDIDEADYSILKLGNDKGKFALQIAVPLAEREQFAFERGIDKDWFRLVDISPLAEFPNPPLKVFRIFKMTSLGRSRLATLKATGRWKLEEEKKNGESHEMV